MISAYILLHLPTLSQRFSLSPRLAFLLSAPTSKEQLLPIPPLRTDSSSWSAGRTLTVHDFRAASLLLSRLPGLLVAAGPRRGEGRGGVEMSQRGAGSLVPEEEERTACPGDAAEPQPEDGSAAAALNFWQHSCPPHLSPTEGPCPADSGPVFGAQPQALSAHSLEPSPPPAPFPLERQHSQRQAMRLRRFSPMEVSCGAHESVAALLAVSAKGGPPSAWLMRQQQHRPPAQAEMQQPQARSAAAVTAHADADVVPPRATAEAAAPTPRVAPGAPPPSQQAGRRDVSGGGGQKPEARGQKRAAAPAVARGGRRQQQQQQPTLDLKPRPH